MARIVVPEELKNVLRERQELAKAWRQLNDMRREAMQPQPVIIQAESKGRKRYHSGSSQTVMIERCIDYELQLKEWGLDYFQERQRILDRVHTLQIDYVCMEVLYKRFFEGKTQDQIARELHYDSRSLRKVFRQALAAYIQTYYPETDLPPKDCRQAVYRRTQH